MKAAAGTRPGSRPVPTNAGLALLGDAASKAAALATIAICARLLPLEQFAHLGVALAALTVLTSFADAGIATLIVRDGADRPDRARELMRTSIAIRAPLFALVCAAGVAGGLFVGDVWLGAATALAAVAGALSQSLTALFRSAQDLAPEAIQKCAVAAVALVAASLVAAESARASAVVTSLGIALALSVVPLWLRARRRFPAGKRRSAGIDTIRSAMPFGLMAVATLLYYRLGTLLLGAVGSPSATSSYTVASTLAFGLLMVPNAITTGLLPRLSAQSAESDRVKTTRRALRWTVLICLLVSAVAASVAPYVLRYGFAPRYEDALVPLLVLLAGTVVIGANGILGTILIAHRHATVVAVQVGVSLVVNVALCAALVPRFGADGAAVSTLVTELVALVLLVAATQRFVPSLFQRRRLANRQGLLVEVHQEARL